MMAKSTSLYKLRDMQTGLFATSSYFNKWDVKGKAYATMGSLRCQLTNWMKWRKTPMPITWEVVEFSLVEASSFPAGVFEKKSDVTKSK